MPVQPTYPGVYIEEISSGVRTITGVATSITAFIGRALMGPINEPVTINSFGDYERWFGGLWIESTMSYAVQDFYQNGGSQALIVRIYAGEVDEDAEVEVPPITKPGKAKIELKGKHNDDTLATLVLEAVSPGKWGNNLSATVNHDTKDPTNSVVPADVDTTLFNLIVYERKGSESVVVEQHLNVSLKPTETRFVSRILAQNSARLLVKDASSDWKTLDVITTAAAAAGGLDGVTLIPTDYKGKLLDKTGIYAFTRADLFNLLCIPPPVRGADTDPSVYSAAAQLCVDERALLIVDPPLAWGSSIPKATSEPIAKLNTLGISGTQARNAALYYPLIKKTDPNRANQLDDFVPCGAIAGIMAKTDTSRGVWKAPAGIDAAINGIVGLQVNLSDMENGQLNKIGINCLRSFPITGNVVWGARTLRGADQLADEWKYVPVRRTAMFIEESLYRATHWVVFEPNDESLWAQIRLNIGAFMQGLFRQGAFQGKTPKEAYLVKCDKETTTQNDINSGIVNIVVGFAPLKPAEFVIIKIQQLAGQIDI